MTACELRAEGGPSGTIRAYCDECGFVTLLELPVSVDAFAAWSAAQEHAHKAFRDTQRDAARKVDDALARAREADHDYAEIALDRDDLPRPYKACAHCGRAKAYCKGRKP